MSPNDPLPIFLPSRYLLPTLSSMVPQIFNSLHIQVELLSATADAWPSRREEGCNSFRRKGSKVQPISLYLCHWTTSTTSKVVIKALNPLLHWIAPLTQCSRTCIKSFKHNILTNTSCIIDTLNLGSSNFGKIQWKFPWFQLDWRRIWLFALFGLGFNAD